VTQVLARKWRPRSFPQLVGQEHVVRALTNALRQKRLHHAYLFTGTRGVGKTTLARIMAKSLNCETGITEAPCGSCSTCTEIDAGRFVDLIELDAASNTQVDNMRELLENAMYAPTSGRYKVYIIDEVHMLSRNAFNAMLKTLEEPPAHVLFILATTDPQKIPVTVLSRCLQFNLKQIPQHQISGQLQKVLEAEGVPFEAAALQLLARAAQGSLRDSLSLLDQAIAHGAGRVEENATRAMLGSVDQGYLHAILRALAAGDGPGLIAEAQQMMERSLSLEAALQDLGALLHRLALVQAVPETITNDDPDRLVLTELAGRFDAEELQLYYQITVQGRSEIGLAPDEYAGFTMTLLRMLAFAPEASGTAAPPVSATPATPRSKPAATVPAGNTPSGLQQQAAAPEQPQGQQQSWLDIVSRLPVSGMARMLAQHCEMIHCTAERVDLRVARGHERLLEKAYQERLKAALQQHFGAAVRISITAGEAGGNSPMEIANREKQRNQAQAIAEIEQDPFVRDLVENFDARVNESTIQPVQTGEP